MMFTKASGEIVLMASKMRAIFDASLRVPEKRTKRFAFVSRFGVCGLHFDRSRGLLPLELLPDDVFLVWYFKRRDLMSLPWKPRRYRTLIKLLFFLELKKIGGPKVSK